MSKFWTTGDIITETKFNRMQNGIGKKGLHNILSNATLENVEESSGDYELSTGETTGTIEKLIKGKGINAFRDIKLNTSNLDSNNSLSYEIKKKNFTLTDYANVYDNKSNTSLPINNFFFNSDGSKLYLDGTTINQYSLGVAFDITTATSDSKSLSLFDINTSYPAYSVLVDNDTKLFCSYRKAVSPYYLTTRVYTLSTAGDISTATLAETLVSSLTTSANNIQLNTDGDKIFILGCSKVITLSTAYDLSTYDSSDGVDTGGGGASFSGFKLFPNGDRYCYFFQDTSKVGSPWSYKERSLSTAWDPSTTLDTFISVVEDEVIGDPASYTPQEFQFIGPDNFLVSNSVGDCFQFTSANTYRIASYTGLAETETSLIAETEITDNLDNNYIDLSSISEMTDEDDYLYLKYTLARDVSGDTSPTVSNSELTYETKKAEWIELYDGIVDADNETSLDIDLAGYQKYKIIFVGEFDVDFDEIRMYVNGDDSASNGNYVYENATSQDYFKLSNASPISAFDSAETLLVEIEISDEFFGVERCGCKMNAQSLAFYELNGFYRNSAILSSISVEFIDSTTPLELKIGSKYKVYGMNL